MNTSLVFSVKENGFPPLLFLKHDHGGMSLHGTDAENPEVRFRLFLSGGDARTLGTLRELADTYAATVSAPVATDDDTPVETTNTTDTKPDRPGE